MSEDKEIWASTIRGTLFIKTYDIAGKLTDTAVRSGKKVAVTTSERHLNQEMAANKDLDMFMNGQLAPVKILESVDDYHEIASNPNLISEGEMGDLFKLKGRSFTTRIGQISNVATLQRLQEVAALNETAATVPQVRAIEERISELSPSEVTDREVVGQVPDGLNAKPITVK